MPIDYSKLIPPEIADPIPGLYDTENEPNPLVHVKLFFPNSSWYWFITEMNKLDGLCFGLVNGFELELGYFSLEELLTETDTLGCPIERDEHWTPVPLRQLQEELHLKRMRVR